MKKKCSLYLLCGLLPISNLVLGSENGDQILATESKLKDARVQVTPEELDDRLTDSEERERKNRHKALDLIGTLENLRVTPKDLKAIKAEEKTYLNAAKDESKAQLLCETVENLEELGVHYEDLYTQANVDLMKDSRFKIFAKNVVRTQEIRWSCEAIPTKLNGYSPRLSEKAKLEDGVSCGTGTLIDVGIESLKGRVVLTCAHCGGFPPDNFGSLPKEYSFCKKKIFSGSDQIFDLSYFPFDVACTENCEERDKYLIDHYPNDSFRRLRRRSYFVVTSQNNPPLFASPFEAIKSVEEGKISAVDAAYIFSEDDNCILFLKEPVKHNGHIVPGIPLQNLLPLSSIPNNAKGDVYVTGYGLTATKESWAKKCVDTDFLIGREVGVKEFLEKFGWNIKKTICAGDYVTLMNFLHKMQKASSSSPEEVDNILEQQVTIAGPGFSGSLAIFIPEEEQQLKEDKETFQCICIYGGSMNPLFTERMKESIKKCAEDYEKYSKQRDEHLKEFTLTTRVEEYTRIENFDPEKEE